MSKDTDARLSALESKLDCLIEGFLSQQPRPREELYEQAQEAERKYLSKKQAKRMSRATAPPSEDLKA